MDTLDITEILSKNDIFASNGHLNLSSFTFIAAAILMFAAVTIGYVCSGMADRSKGVAYPLLCWVGWLLFIASTITGMASLFGSADRTQQQVQEAYGIIDYTIDDPLVSSGILPLKGDARVLHDVTIKTEPGDISYFEKVIVTRDENIVTLNSVGTDDSSIIRPISPLQE